MSRRVFIILLIFCLLNCHLYQCKKRMKEPDEEPSQDENEDDIKEKKDKDDQNEKDDDEGSSDSEDDKDKDEEKEKSDDDDDDDDKEEQKDDDESDHDDEDNSEEKEKDENDEEDEEDEEEDEEEDKEEEEEDEEEENSEEEEEEKDEDDDEEKKEKKRKNKEKDDEEEKQEAKIIQEIRDKKILEEKIMVWCQDHSKYEETGRFDDLIQESEFCLRQIDNSIKDEFQNEKQYDNLRQCIHRINFEDIELKEDFQRLTFCFQNGYLELKPFQHQEPSPTLKGCFNQHEITIDEQHLALMNEIDYMCSDQNEYKDIDECIYSLNGYDSQFLEKLIGAYKCINNHEEQHGDIYPTCFNEQYTPFDEEHEQFNEQIELHCYEQLKNVMDTHVNSDEFDSYTQDLKTCVNNIEYQNDLPKQQYSSVIDCYQNSLQNLQFSFTSKKLNKMKSKNLMNDKFNLKELWSY